MSKSSISSEISNQYIESLAGVIVDTNASLKAISETHKKQLESQNKYYQTVIDKYNKGEATEKEVIKKLLEVAKDVRIIDNNLQETSRFNKGLGKLERSLADAVRTRGGQLTPEIVSKLITAISNFESTAIIQSSKAKSAGTNNALLKNIDNENLKKIVKDISNSMDINTNGAIYKLQGFFREHFHQAKKDLRAFGVDLIEGLAANKFVGGALKDTFKLIGLLGASWLSHFGRLGQILGTAFYVAMETAGPLLATLLVKGLGSIIGKGFLTLGNTIWKAASFIALGAGKGLMNLSVRGGGSIAELATAGSIGQKVSAVAKVGGALGGGALGLGGAFLAGREAIKDWKEGYKGRATAFGVGAGFLGAGGIAAIATLFTAAATPFVAPLLAIGAGIAGLTALWKKYGENVKKWFGERKKDTENWIKEHKDSLKAVTDILLLFNPALLGIKKVVEWIWNILPWSKNKDGNNGGGGSSGGSSGGGSLGQPMSGKDSKANIAGATTFGSLKVAKDGAILNISDLSQAEASKQLQAYEKADPTSFGKVYEWAGSNVARLGSFKTDAAKLNEKGQVTGALMYKGATDDMLALRNNVEAEFIRKGYDSTRAHALANSLAYTSGKMTGSNTQHKGKGKWKSHDNVYGFGFDIGGGQAWSEKEYDAVAGVVKDFYKTKGLQVAYEGAGQGASTGKHWDIKPIKDMRAKGAQEILDEKKEKQKVEAEQHSMDAAYILMKEDEQLARKILKEHSSETPEEIGKRYEEALNKKGIYNRPFTTAEGTQGVWVRETDEGSKVIDYSENSSFTEDYLRNVTRNGAGQ